MDLDSFFKENKIDTTKFEGYCQLNKEETDILINLVKQKNIKNVMEIGFNAGHSAELFLENNDNVKLTSFELGKHKYTKKGKKFIDEKYKNRHTMIIGNSVETVPNFAKNNPDKKFDLIFIDGAHHYEIADQDMKNCYKLAHTDTIVILDDTNTNPKTLKKWQKGPNKVWKESKENGLIKELGYRDCPPRHGLSWGKYIF